LALACAGPADRKIQSAGRFWAGNQIASIETP
jgi:hypothetical protein